MPNLVETPKLLRSEMVPAAISLHFENIVWYSGERVVYTGLTTVRVLLKDDGLIHNAVTSGKRPDEAGYMSIGWEFMESTFKDAYLEIVRLSKSEVERFRRSNTDFSF